MVDRTWARWIFGLLVFSAALSLTLLSAPLEESSRFILFIGATALGSWYGGVALGLAVASVSAVVIALAPLYFATLTGDLVPLAAFVGVALLITWIDVQRSRAEGVLADELALEHDGREEAEAANRAQEDFFATISHELGGPLTAILSWVRLLQKGTLDEATAVHALEVVARNVQASARLVGEMLDVSRIITGNVLLDLAPVELGAIVEQAVDSARPAAEASGILLESELALVPGAVVGDSDRLAQVVRNLLSNAIKFTPRGGRVAIQLGGDGQQDATITVRDTGQGIRPDFLAHVFDRFRQGGSPAFRRARGGLGLGLAIVRDLVELHGGTVRAESGGENEGARFTVTLPTGERSNQSGALLPALDLA
jgi:signal transduction histidine kinase